MTGKPVFTICIFLILNFKLINAIFICHACINFSFCAINYTTFLSIEEGILKKKFEKSFSYFELILDYNNNA